MRLFLVFLVIFVYRKNNHGFFDGFKTVIEFQVCLIGCIKGREVTCSKKGFVCYDDTRFYQCVHKSGKYFIKGNLKSCPSGLLCKNDAELECEEEIPRDYILASNVEAIDADTDHKFDEI